MFCMNTYKSSRFLFLSLPASGSSLICKLTREKIKKKFDMILIAKMSLIYQNRFVFKIQKKAFAEDSNNSNGEKQTNFFQLVFNVLIKFTANKTKCL